MKKKMNEINGLLLSNKQMKELKGGKPTVCGGGYCSGGNTCRFASFYDSCKCSTPDGVGGACGH